MKAQDRFNVPEKDEGSNDGVQITGDKVTSNDRASALPPKVLRVKARKVLSKAVNDLMKLVEDEVTGDFWEDRINEADEKCFSVYWASGASRSQSSDLPSFS